MPPLIGAHCRKKFYHLRRSFRTLIRRDRPIAALGLNLRSARGPPSKFRDHAYRRERPCAPETNLIASRRSL